MEDDLSLVNKVKMTGDSDAMSQIINSHTGIFVQTLEKSLPTDQFSTQREDFKNERAFHMYDAVMKYKPDSAMKFSTFLGQTIKWKCLTLKNRGPDKDTVFIDSLESPIAEKEPDDCSGKFKVEEIFQYAEKYPNELARKIVNLRYDSGSKVSWKQVAKTLDISVSWATLIHAQFIKDAKLHFSSQAANAF
jgi:DNA-directed RNA polymerase specialized sigma subunit